TLDDESSRRKIEASQHETAKPEHSCVKRNPSINGFQPVKRRVPTYETQVAQPIERIPRKIMSKRMMSCEPPAKHEVEIHNASQVQFMSRSLGKMRVTCAWNAERRFSAGADPVDPVFYLTPTAHTMPSRVSTD
ncbi:hypothetical protein HAX54_003239, partial [Datura stramonium]|nr:hypothetical protein [Datura stramonium]